MTDLKVVEIETLVQWRLLGFTLLSLSLFHCDFFDHLLHRAGVNGAHAMERSGEDRRRRLAVNAYCFSGGKFLVIASGGWMGSYSALFKRLNDHLREHTPVLTLHPCRHISR